MLAANVGKDVEPAFKRLIVVLLGHGLDAGDGLEAASDSLRADVCAVALFDALVHSLDCFSFALIPEIIVFLWVHVDCQVVRSVLSGRRGNISSV